MDDYEITPSYIHELDKQDGTVKTKEEPWVVADDDGVPSHSLLPPPVTLSMIKQIAQILEARE